MGLFEFITKQAGEFLHFRFVFGGEVVLFSDIVFEVKEFEVFVVVVIDQLPIIFHDSRSRTDAGTFGPPLVRVMPVKRA